MERYARHVVCRVWIADDIPRPVVSFDTLRDAVAWVDKHDIEEDYHIYDIEHLTLGNMLKAEACAGLIKQIRNYIADPPVTEADFAPPETTSGEAS
jgi:hypothetical protein